MKTQVSEDSNDNLKIRKDADDQLALQKQTQDEARLFLLMAEMVLVPGMAHLFFAIQELIKKTLLQAEIAKTQALDVKSRVKVAPIQQSSYPEKIDFKKPQARQKLQFRAPAKIEFRPSYDLIKPVASSHEFKEAKEMANDQEHENNEGIVQFRKSKKPSIAQGLEKSGQLKKFVS